jgi:hypothetical protein
LAFNSMSSLHYFHGSFKIKYAFRQRTGTSLMFVNFLFDCSDAADSSRLNAYAVATVLRNNFNLHNVFIMSKFPIQFQGSIFTSTGDLLTRLNRYVPVLESDDNVNRRLAR